MSADFKPPVMTSDGWAEGDSGTVDGAGWPRAESGTGPAAIEAIGLGKRFGAVTAVDGVSLAVAPGEIFGFLGPNGAGKTTTIKMLVGLLKPSAGSARIAGFDVHTAALQAKARLGYAPDTPVLPDGRIASGNGELVAAAVLLLKQSPHVQQRRESAT